MTALQHHYRVDLGIRKQRLYRRTIVLRRRILLEVDRIQPRTPWRQQWVESGQRRLIQFAS